MDPCRPDRTASSADRERVGSELRGAAGVGYAGEWGLFCDYTAAIGQPALPTTLAALTGFLAALPARPATLARRVRAIAAAHRRAGYLLERPAGGPGASPSAPARTRPDPELMIAGCPTRGWPDGLWGRRDAFLIVLTEHLGCSHPAARDLHPEQLVLPLDDQEPLSLAGLVVGHRGEARSCPACAVLRWLEILGVADGLGRGSARMTLTAARAPAAGSAHEPPLVEPARWRGAPVLLPAIDRHGWHDDFRPMTTRTIRARLALAAQRASNDALVVEPDAPGQPQRPPRRAERGNENNPEGASNSDRRERLLDFGFATCCQWCPF